MRIRIFLQKYGPLCLLLAWVLMWGMVFSRVNHPIEDRYISAGITFGWLWALMFGCKFANWGKPFDVLGEKDE